jgi:hypothetical protein
VDRRDPVVAVIQPDRVALPKRMAADRAGISDPPGLFGGLGRAGGGRVSRIEAVAHELLELVTRRSRDGRRGSLVGLGLGVDPGLGLERVAQPPCELAGDRRRRGQRGRVGLVPFAPLAPGAASLGILDLQGVEEVLARVGHRIELTHERLALPA